MKKKKNTFLFLQFAGLFLLILSAFPTKKIIGVDFFSKIDGVLSNLKFKVRGPKSPSGEVIVVAIDRLSIETLGRWPWRRNAIALLTEALFSLGVKNVGFDIGFMEIHADEFVQNREFEQTLRTHSNQITLSWWSQDLCDSTCSSTPLKASPPNPVFPNIPEAEIQQFENPELNHKIFSEAVRNQGFGNATKDSSGQVRKAYYFLRDLKGVYPSFPLAVISQRLGKKPETLVPSFDSPIDYLGPQETLPRFSAVELMKLAGERNLASEAPPDLKGKTAIIGVTAFGLVDEQVSPFDSAIHGVEIQASIADQILRQSFPKEPKILTWVVTIILSFGFLFLTPFLKTKELVGMFFGVLVLGIWVDFKILFPKGIFANTGLFYANLSVLVVSTLSYRFFEEFKQRKFLKNAFSKYLAPDVVEILLAQPEALSLGTQKKEITTLFCDLRNFTQLSEKLSPNDLTQVLNETFTVLTRVIFKHQGTLDKYIGDAIMAFFGAPIEMPDHASRACIAAKEMVAEFALKQSEFKRRFGIELSFGIGINTGIASVGNMGTQERFSYTAIGDSVNIAARVESSTKELGATILTTQTTLDAIKSSGISVPNYRFIRSTRLKGKSQPLDLFELV